MIIAASDKTLRPPNLIRRRVSFGQATHQLERSKSVISLAAIFSDLRAVLFLRDSPDSFQEIAFRRPMRIDEEDRLFVRKIVLRIRN